ncbi:SIR2 family protein [Acinetobacter pittii]|uniref:SIR2 family protein n=1 Tax=Acinetobacter pittii TaxID=48296 RepID=UPI0033153184
MATEEDYDSFLKRFPMIATFITNLFISKTVLFIGYSVDDNDIRQIFQMIKDRLGNLKRRAYTIRINSSIQEINRFSRRGINVINIPIHEANKDYNQIFSDIFEELNDYWTQNIPNNATEEDSEIDLKLAKIISNSVSRISYFSVDNDALPYYKTNIFPIFYNYGFTAVTPDDFLDSNENYFARIQSLINISSICIIDFTKLKQDPHQELERSIRRLITSKDNFHLIIIQDSSQNIDIDAFYKPLKKLQPNTSDRINNQLHFINFDKNKNSIDLEKLEKILSIISHKVYSNFDNETQKLLRNKQYNIALLTGYITLEKTLREYFKDYKLHPLKLSDRLIQENIIAKNDARLLLEARTLRNQVAHGLTDIELTEKNVLDYLNLFKRIQEKLNIKKL